MQHLTREVFLQTKEYGTRLAPVEGPIRMGDAMLRIVERLKASSFRKQLTFTLSFEPPAQPAKADDEWDLAIERLTETLESQGLVQPATQEEEQAMRESATPEGQRLKQLRSECFRALRLDYPAGRLLPEEYQHWARVAEENGWHHMIR